ncbi:glycosyltransferase family 4 protein [bacterium]|nr:glycosyltransferase family 4 protein [bacterium]
MVHNAYARPSGEEHAVRAISDLLESRGVDVAWFSKSSAELAHSLSGKFRALVWGMHNPHSRAEIARLLDESPVDVVQVQNLFPQISPSIFKPCRERGIPVVMRCPNYRLFCPQGLFLSRGHVCERCAAGREWWCAARNCTGSVPKSIAYAARNAWVRISRSILDNVSTFMVLSRFQRDKFIEHGIPPGRIAIVPNFEMVPPRAEDDDDRAQAISFVGRVSPEKGIAQFIEAARRLPQYPFAVAGDCSPMPRAVETAPSNVTFHGFLAGPALDEFYRRTRVLVCPSIWYEGFPNVVAHAMAAGKPVIACRLGALPEIVGDGETGLLFDPDDIDTLTAHIRRLFGDSDLCRAMGEAGRRKIEREFSPSAVYEKLTAVYQSLIKAPTPASPSLTLGLQH